MSLRKVIRWLFLDGANKAALDSVKRADAQLQQADAALEATKRHWERRFAMLDSMEKDMLEESRDKRRREIKQRISKLQEQ